MRKPSLNLQKFHSGEVDGQLAMNCSRVEERECYDIVFRRFDVYRKGGVYGCWRQLGKLAISCVSTFASIPLQKVHRYLTILATLFLLMIQYFLLVLAVVAATPG